MGGLVLRNLSQLFELDEPATVCSTLNSYYTQHGLGPAWKKFRNRTSRSPGVAEVDY